MLYPQFCEISAYLAELELWYEVFAPDLKKVWMIVGVFVSIVFNSLSLFVSTMTG